MVAGDGLVTLREAIHAANTDTATDLQQLADGADEIRFDASLNGGTILLAGGQLDISEALTIDASALPAGLTINAQRRSRILDITAETGDFTIAGLTLTAGRTTDSQPPVVALEIALAQVADDAGGHGGAIRSLTTGDLTITDSTVSGSRTEGADADGGGIYARGDVMLNRSAVTGNFTQGDDAEGGGIHSLGDVLLVNSTVSGNSTQGVNARGGGIYARGSITLDHSHVRVNHTIGTFAAGAGIAAGDVDADGGAVTIFNSTVSGNFTIGSAAHGTGIAAWGPVAILHSDVIYNIAFHPSPVGGGVWNDNDAIDIANSIVALNSATGGSPDIRPGGPLNVAFSLIGNNSGTDLVAAPLGSPDAKGNLIGTDQALIDPLLGPHAENGGPTLTHALLPGSPAIDAGNPNAVAGFNGVPEFDQRGAPFVRVDGARIDMGAFEFQFDPPPPPPPPVPPTSLAEEAARKAPLPPLPLPPFITEPPFLFVAEPLRFPESDGGSGGGLPLEEDNFGPRADSDAERKLRDLLSTARMATREEVVDAVYALGDIERISLIGFDMGDEPLAARKKQTKQREPAENANHVIVNKPPTELAAQDDSGWPALAIWCALAGGGTLWISGAWWWLGRARRRATQQLSGT